MSALIHILLLFLQLNISGTGESGKEILYIRINQVGYLPEESKTGIAFSHSAIKVKFDLIEEESGSVVLTIKPRKIEEEGWGTFAHYYELDFSQADRPGRYRLESKKSGSRSQVFIISSEAYDHQQEKLLGFMRQQRCGYNPFLDMVCHQKDGRSAYGPMPDSTFVDVSGGWHDAGDQLKYLITGSYATAHMLLAYELFPERFGDRMNGLGQPGPNGIPDVLDEAKWGLDWILNLHPAPDLLVHQVADDRDHVGWKIIKAMQPG